MNRFKEKTNNSLNNEGSGGSMKESIFSDNHLGSDLSNENMLILNDMNDNLANILGEEIDNIDEKI